MKELAQLQNIDELKPISLFGKQGFIHKDHRFTLPLVLYAQRKGILPQPCNLILFDAHHDCCPPLNLDEVKMIDIQKIKINDFIEFCDKKLRSLDDDWIKSGLEIGLFKDVVIFGVQQDDERNQIYSDNNGVNHNIFIKRSHPGPMLEYQGDLSDYTRDKELKLFWETISWYLVPKQGFSFKGKIEPFLLDFDLDCFSMSWEEFTFPWPKEIYEKKYFKISDYWSTKHQTGKDYLHNLIKFAGFITIATEPGCCGNEGKSKTILNDLNNLLFDNKMQISN